jgi:hypothetical protein
LIEYLPRALERPLGRLDIRIPPETGKTAGSLLLSAALQGVSAQLNALTGRLDLWQALTRKVAMLDATEAELTIQTGWREPVRRHLLAAASWHGREPDVTFDLAMGALHLPREAGPRSVSSSPLRLFSFLAPGAARSGPRHAVVARFARRAIAWTEWT